jgi:hypothetical protein
MKRTGTAELPLHGGSAPAWLLTRMRGLASPILAIIVDTYGADELLRRLAQPAWFQALGCVLGFDWHSSGVTTVLTGVLKSVMKPELGITVAGGKGKRSRMAPAEIREIGREFQLGEEQVDGLVRASRLSAKVDNTAIQSGHTLYHHAFFITEEGRWAVVQQGMDPDHRTARRYHWLSEHVLAFTDAPHDAIVGETVEDRVLDMTAHESGESRRVSVDLVREGIAPLRSAFLELRKGPQKTLDSWTLTEGPRPLTGRVVDADLILRMPRSINWDALERAYELQPRNYDELLAVQGVGRAAIRGLALVSEMVYGAEPSWRDPVRYSFAYGGKDGVPRPVDRRAMDESIEFLRRAVDEARLGRDEKLSAFRRLGQVELAGNVIQNMDPCGPR